VDRGPSMSDAQAYYDGLLTQNYSPDQALQHTQQYFPDFQPVPAAAAPAPAPEPAREPASAPVPEPVVADAPEPTPAPEPAVADAPGPAAAAPMAAAPMAAAPPAAEAPATSAPDAAGGGDGGGLVDMLFKFDGRISSKEWWVCVIVTSIVASVIYFLIHLIATIITIPGPSFLKYTPPLIAMLWIFIALSVKRLRDRGK